MPARRRSLPLLPRECRADAPPLRQAIFLAAVLAFGVSCVLGLVTAWTLWERPPGIGIDHTRLGRERLRAGAYAEAVPELRAAQRIDWSNRRGALELADTLERSGDLAGSAMVLREALADGGADVVLYGRLAEVLFESGRLDESLVAVEAAIRLDPADAQSHLNRGNLFFLRRELEPALQAYRQAIALDPLLAKAEHGMGAAHLLRGELDESLAAYQRALVLDPRMASAHNGVGLVHLQRGEAAAARDAFLEALRLEPGDRAARDNRARAEAMLRDEAPADG